MGPLILGVVVDVLIHVLIELRHSVVVRLISSATWFLTVLNSGEFVVLNPEICFENFGRSREPKNRSVAFTEVWPAFAFSGGQERRSGCKQSRTRGHSTEKCSPPKGARS